ncbi:MAG: DUF2812 domain-containing protein [Negativicutes bacterium]|nr:DUF2812 domain-containing protein [Negativicutes bacterium]
MAAEMTQTEPFPLWDVEAFEKYLQIMSAKGWHLQERQSKLTNSRIRYEEEKPNFAMKYRIWLSEAALDEQFIHTLTSQGWARVTVLRSDFCLRKYYFNIFQSQEDQASPEKMFDDQLEYVYNRLGNVKLKAAGGVIVILLFWIAITFFIRFMHWPDPLTSAAAVFPYAMLRTIFIAWTMIRFGSRLKAPQTNELTQIEVEEKIKTNRLLKILGFVISASLFTCLYYFQLGK